jgi:hypothetical protein
MFFMSPDPFRQSIRQQIAINRARTPTQRFEAFLELMEATRAMMPMDPAAIERRRRAQKRRDREREEFREFCKRLAEAERMGVQPCV